MRTARITGPVLAAAIGLAGPVAAQEAGPFGGFRHDSSKPIEIVSDALEVRQAENLAIFSGAVEAGQGTLRLTADRVVVSYDREKTDSETGAIRNMKAEGNVFLSNGTETAEGAAAEYDVASGMMFMRGGVVLTQGGNAVAGNELEIDLKTGRAQMKGGRVKSIFRPSSGPGN